MAAQIISATEDFVRTRFAEAIEERRPIGPVTTTMLDVLMTETASHVAASTSWRQHFPGTSSEKALQR
jgi:hypothetical protein